MKKIISIFTILCFTFLNQTHALTLTENYLNFLANETDLAENITEGTFATGANKLINNSPTASLVYTVAGNVVDHVRENDVVTLTATFDHDINSDITMMIDGHGAQDFNGGMTRVSSTVYNYTYTVDSGSGVQNFLFENGQDLDGNLVTPDPSSGASIHHNPSVLNYSYEDFELNNPNAVKINIIYLTNDINLITLPVDSNGVEWGMAQVEELISESNTAFNELYDASNWPGFELGRITKAYNTSHYNTENPHGVLFDISTQPVAQKDYLNIVIVKVNREVSNVAGTTFQNSSTRGTNGTTLVLSSVDEGMVPIHEIGHVIGLPHWTGNGWPPPHGELPLQDGSVMGFTSLNHSGAESNYMGSWGSNSTDSFIDINGNDAAVSLYLTSKPQTFNTPAFGNIGSEVFRSWLIANEYILSNAPATGYVGHDTSLSVASDWLSEGVNEFSSLPAQAFPKIVASQNENNNYAAVSFLNETGSQLSYSYRDNNSVWGPVTTIQGVDGDFHGSEMAMSSNGDVIIITETWVEGAIKVFSKDVEDASWTNSLVISDSGTSDLRNSRAKVSMNASGNAVAVWLRNDNNMSQIVFKERLAGSWSSATVLSLDNSKNELPSIAYNNNGDVLVSWQQWNANSFKYEVVGKFRNGATNNWSSLESYGNPDSTAGFSQVALDADGNALVYWRQAGFSKYIECCTPKPRSGFLNVRYRNFNGTLEEAVQLTDTEKDAFNGATFHNENRVVFLEDGTAAATWWINDGTNPGTIYSSAMPSKNVWTTPVALSNSGHNANMSKITPGKGGDYSVIWQRPDGLNTRIQTRTYHASTSNWSAISTLSDSNYDAIWGDIASDGDNQLSAMWVRNDGTKHIPEVKRFSLNPFITETTITPDNSSISISFNEAVYNAIGAAGALEANDFTLSITGGTATIASTTPTSISSNENTYTLGVSFTGIPDGTETLTVVPADSGVIFDSGDNAASTSQNNNSVALNDMTSHTASLVYTINGSSVSSVTEGDEVLITATFNQEIEDSPIVQISGSGVNSISASNMTKVNNKEYTYSWTVTTGSGVQNFELETGTNSEGTVIAATPSSGATIIVVNNISPTATFNYTIATPIGPQNAESSVNAAKENDVVTITALFSEAMADFPSVQISGTGMDTFNPINMTKVSSTEYTFNWRAVSGDGIQNFTLGTGKDLGGNVITPTPSSGASIIIDNTQPMVGLVYTIDGTEVSAVTEGDEVLITATFNEAISDDGIKINGYGSTTVPFSDMTKVSTTEYTYLWTVGAGQGNTDFGLGYGTDTVGNEITNNYMTGRSILVDNSSPTALIDWEGVTTVAPGSVITVYVTFSETMANSPVPQISGSGANTIAATDLVPHNLEFNIYKYIWTVGENTGTQTFSVSTGTDLLGNITEETLTSGGTILIDILPTAALSYTVNGTAVSSTVKQGDEVLITATFNKEMADSPVVQIYAEGLNETSPSDMTKINSTSYSYTLTVGSGNGNQYFRMATGTDLAGTLIEEDPTSGETLIIDNTPPTITLLGDPIVNIEVGATYTDAGANADDNADGPVITNNIVAVSTVNTSVIGNYTVTYNVNDAAGNAATQVTREVNVTGDETNPVITLTGDVTVTIEVGTDYTDAGATAIDNSDGDLTSSIVTVSTVNTATVGVYSVTYNVSDTAGNAATQVTRTVNVVDTTVPVITLSGDATVTIEVGALYTDAGATATDNFDGVLTSSIVTVSTVNTATVGVYSVTYNVSDTAGNAATQVTRTVNVVDTTIPIITLEGDATVTIEIGTNYTDAGATATDNVDGDITSSIVVTGTADVNVLGNYTIIYDVSDAAGNEAIQVTRTVNVVDTTIPIIILEGDAIVTIEVGAVYTDAGATATDNADGELTSSIVTESTVNTAIVGSYTVTYNVIDTAGNAAAQVTRTVNVVDTTVPVITLSGDATVTIEVGAVYTDAGATATDNYDGNITDNITIVNPVNTAIVGSYTVTYNVNDAAGNPATQKTRAVNIVDTTVPVITLSGDATVTIWVGAVYTDAGATATDNYDGNITDNITIVNPVNTAIVGSYTVTYNVSDTAGNAATQVTRTVNVEDTTIPIIILEGDAIVTIEVGAVYTDAGATATDNADGDLTSSIVTVSTVNTAIVGSYTVTYNVIDTAGNEATQVTRTVNVEDTTIPVITLEGDATVTIEVGTDYTDAGATAWDNYDGDITNNITIVNSVDTSVVGSYTVTYNVSDTAGNAATQVTRTVNVEDTTIPVITLVGDATVTIEVGTDYTDAGATATDNVDGDITSSIVTVNSVNTNVVGSYTVTYNVSDAAGNAATQKTRIVSVDNPVDDNTAPVITLVGDATVTIEVGTDYTDAGATATDNVDGDLTSSIEIVSTVNTAIVGSYTVTYNVSDTAGNPAAQVTRTVNVVDTTIPVITLEGDATVTIEVGTNYTDAGATASDNYDGDITNNITIVNSVDTSVVGSYTVTYNASDTAGNAAAQVTRTVNVEDTTIPVITLVGDATVTIEVGTNYTDAGATASDNYDGDITNNITIVNSVDTSVVGSYTVTYNVSDAAGNAATQITRTVNVTADQTSPEITLVGANPQSIELGTAYSELGATATDNIDGNITENIVIDATAVNVNALGDYTVTYNVSDIAGNIAEEVTRTVNVVDTSDPVPPVIILLGSSSVFVELGTDYTDAGATASDGIGGNITSSIVATGTVDVNVLGNYTISYDVSDAAGNEATQVTRNVTVVNYSVPVITLLGDAIISLQKGAPYFDLGATALDSTDGDITNHINIVNPVNINDWGTYTITYNVSNSAGTAAIEVTRTVVIPEEFCDFSEDFEDFPPAGWTILNSNTQSNDITQTDVTSRDGMYSLRFSSKEVDTSYDQYLVSPAFTPSDIEKEISFYYLASEADEEEVFKVGWSTTGDNLETDFAWSEEIIAQSAEDLNDMYLYSKDDLPVGTKYVAIHYYSDNKNHLYIDRLCLHSTPVGSFNPGITLIGAEDVAIKLGSTYTDAGAIAFSEEGVNITANIVTVNPVDENSEGTYTITYNVSDTNGNQATEVTRTVTVFTSMWNGSVDNDWDTAANWSSNSVPGPTASVRIPKTGITNFPTASNAVTLNAVTIESGASLITESTFSGSLTYKRKLHLANDWIFISPPVAGVEVGQVLSTTDVQTGSGMHLGLSYYDNSIPGWEYFTTTSSGIMGSGDGFAVLVNSGDIFFTGTMPTGPVNKSLTRDVNGWNLIGNPYPSYLAINNTANEDINFLDVNSANLSSNYSGIYLWDVANQNSSIKVVNHATGPYNMYPGQGFFVNTNSNGNSVSFTEQMQSHQATGTFYGPIEATPSIILAIENNGNVKTTTVKYFDTATAGLDVGYDAGAFTGGGTSTFNLNTHLPENSEGIDFTLQCLSTQEYETSVIPVALTTEAGLEIAFSVEALNLPTGIKVFLEDRVTNTYTRLDEANSEYIVQLDEPENGIGRFYLHTKSSILTTDTIDLNNIIIYKADASTIRIVGLPQDISTFKLFNILGAQLVKNTFMPKGIVNINLPPLPSGIYIVWLENKFGNVVKRIIIE